MSETPRRTAPGSTAVEHVAPEHVVAKHVVAEPAPRWARFVAVGDSFSEGLWDPYPPSPGGSVRPDDVGAPPTGAAPTDTGDHLDEAVQRGWADRLADALSVRRAAAGLAPLQYANLAIRGRLLHQIIDEQVPVALAAQPDLVSLVGGGNDILRPGVDVDEISLTLEDAVVRLRATGTDVLLAVGFKAGGALSFTRGRTGQFNANVWSIAHKHGAYVLDLWGLRCLTDPRLWAADRIHLTPEGHRRVANAALFALATTPDDAGYDEPLDPAPPAPFVERAKAEAGWAKEHVVPWVKRRLTHTSSGDGRAPKWPSPLPWPESRH